MRWPNDAAYALTDAHPLTTGECHVRAFGFDPADRKTLAWHAVVYSRPDLAPEGLRQVIDGLVPTRR